MRQSAAMRRQGWGAADVSPSWRDTIRDVVFWVVLVGGLAFAWWQLAGCTIHHRVTLEIIRPDAYAVIETDAEAPEPEVILEAEP